MVLGRKGRGSWERRLVRCGDERSLAQWDFVLFVLSAELDGVWRRAKMYAY